MDIQQQLELEEQMSLRGAESYRKMIRSAEEQGRGSETAYARQLIREYVFDISDELLVYLDKKGPGVYGKTRALLKQVDPEKAAFITLKQLFDYVCGHSSSKDLPVVQCASNIGRMIEDEIRFTRFQDKYEAYYTKIIEDFRRKKTQNYRFKHRVMTHTANTAEDGWVAWTSAERVEAGMRMLNIVLERTDLVYREDYFVRGKSRTVLRPTKACVDWIMRYEDTGSLLCHDKAPCVIQPADWVHPEQGGYYSPNLRAATPMVMSRDRRRRKLMRAAHDKGWLDVIYESLNLAQQTAWKVNTRVHDVMKEVWARNLAVGMPSSERLEPSPSPVQDVGKEHMTPLQKEQFLAWKREATLVYTAEKDRQSKAFQVARVLRMASDYRAYNSFWYVWCLDFRGRLYTATNGFSPQGPDVGKGLIHFAEGKRLGERGVYWLKVHLANRYGYDKEHYDVRVKWVEDQHDKWIAIANDPIAHASLWGAADKPYQFLAAVFEYKDMYDGEYVGSSCEDFVSHLPIGLDGSCNGLQHFSAMLRDLRGGKATNLVPQPVPSDIYREVGDVCLEKVKLKEDDMSAQWVKFAEVHGSGKLPRSIPKRPVMTQPYGATRQSCTTYIHAAVSEYDKDHFGALSAFKASVYLTPILWSSIGEVVIAARHAMDWLQKCAVVMNKQGKPMLWRTSDGFPVYMAEQQIDTRQIDTQLAGRFQVVVGTPSDKLDKHGQRNGVSPNFVHSQDAAHLRRTVRLASERGITSIALIHDDYGTHAADTDLLQWVIRETFVQEYEERCPLTEFRNMQQGMSKLALPDVPEKGDLDIALVRESEFFFG